MCVFVIREDTEFHHKDNRELCETYEMRDVIGIINTNRVQWFGLVQQLAESRVLKVYLVQSEEK